ncbi:MAG: undecaprenyl-diphosphate phosphatase [Ilumatobacteraceae bacterium]
MPLFHAIVLGLVQGLSEFLPISSSGHLILVPWLFGWDDFGDASVARAFDVALHIGTLVAVIGYFRKDLVVYVRDGVLLVVKRQRPTTGEGRLAWLLVLSAVPAAIVGALFDDFITDTLGTPAIIAVSLIVFALVLAWADRSTGTRTIDDFTTRDALQVGAAQVLSLNPGTSRSGITISAGRFSRFNRDAAARISFLMSIPVTAGAVVLKVGKLVSDGIPDGLLAPMIVGIITSGLAGWFAVWGTIRLVRTRSFMPFVIYRCVLGVVVLALLATNWR